MVELINITKRQQIMFTTEYLFLYDNSFIFCPIEKIVDILLSNICHIFAVQFN